MSAFVAQNIGAGKDDRALKALKYGIVASLCVGVLIGAFSFFRGDLLTTIFTKDPAVIIQGHEYLKAYAIDCLFTAILFCCIGYYNGCGNTFFVMLQGLIGAFCVRVPYVLLMSKASVTSLFQIGIGTPLSSVVQIILCAGFMLYIQKHKKSS
jgi:Na+-driven multidrug efflux pump